MRAAGWGAINDGRQEGVVRQGDDVMCIMQTLACGTV